MMDKHMDDRVNNIAAFIDMDGTLCDIYLWQAMFSHHKKNRFKLGAMYGFIAYQYPLWILTKMHLLSKEFFTHQNATKLAWLVRNVPIEGSEGIWDWIIKNEIMPHLRPEMVEVIEEHKDKGHRLILISGSFTPLLNKLAALLGVERAIATPLEDKNGLYTGRIIPPLNIGQGKVERLKRFLDGEGRDIDLTASYFYTDSFVDAPVMEMFGHPIAVYPDPDLAEMASTRGWLVIGNHRTDDDKK